MMIIPYPHLDCEYVSTITRALCNKNKNTFFMPARATATTTTKKINNNKKKRCTFIFSVAWKNVDGNKNKIFRQLHYWDAHRHCEYTNTYKFTLYWNV